MTSLSRRLWHFSQSDNAKFKLSGRQTRNHFGRGEPQCLAGFFPAVSDHAEAGGVREYCEAGANFSSVRACLGKFRP